MPKATINLSQSRSSVERSPKSSPANPYRPSVPISVYRQLAAELQNAQAQLKTLGEQNQQLVVQNQQLRQEAQRVIISAQKLQQAINGMSPITESTANLSQHMSDVEKILRQTAASPTRELKPASPPRQKLEPPARQKPEPPVNKKPQKLTPEVQAVRYRRPTPAPQSSSEINGWLLGVAIFFIVILAFGAGFVVVRPLLRSINNNG